MQSTDTMQFPTKITKQFFTEFERTMLNFIWNKTKTKQDS